MYLAIPSTEKKFVWFLVPKTATRSQKAILGPHLDTDKELMVPYDEKYDDYFKWAFVRNPYDRLVSVWMDKTQGSPCKGIEGFVDLEGISFHEFVNNVVMSEDLETTDRHLRLQSSLMPVDKMDFIGRFEKLPNDFDIVLFKSGLFPKKLGKLNHSPHYHYSRYYDNELIELVYLKYKKDFDTFGYDVSFRSKVTS